MITIKLPSGRTIQVNTDDPQVAAAAGRKFMASDPFETGVARSKSNPATGFMATLNRAIPFASEVNAGLASGVDAARDLVSGKPVDIGKSYTGERAKQSGYVAGYGADHPFLSHLATGAGIGAQTAAALATGGGSAAPEIVEGASPIVRTLLNAARNATIGGTAAAINGVSQPGTLQQRAKAANDATPVGMAFGAVLPPALNLAGKVAGAVADTAGGAANTVVRAANKASGGQILEPTREAAKRLAEALKVDGATPEQASAILGSWLKTGASDPTVMDLATRLPSGGQRTMALLRSAALQPGAARGAAVKYADKVAADFQPNVIGRTKALTPDQTPAPRLKANLEAANRTAADEEYRAPYATQIDAAPTLPALAGDTGPKAIRQAAVGADANSLWDQVAELSKLKTAAGAPPPTPVASAATDGSSLPPNAALEAKIRAAMGLDAKGPLPVSLGTLDQLKIALNTMGDDASATAPNVARGYYDRAGQIDKYLGENNGDYATARDNFARRSAGIDAIDHGMGHNGGPSLEGSPDEYIPALEDLTAKGGPDALTNAQIGMRQQITDAMGRPAEGSTGYVNKVATGTNTGANLAATYGEDEAGAYRQALQNEIDRLRNARQIDPTQGSQTAIRGVDEALASLPSLKPQALLSKAIDAIRGGATLTDGEREALMRLSLSPLRAADQMPVDLPAYRAPVMPTLYLPATYLAGADEGRQAQ